MSSSNSIARYATAGHRGNRVGFVHDIVRQGFAQKRRSRAQAGDLNVAARVASKRHNYMKKQRKNTA